MEQINQAVEAAKTVVDTTPHDHSQLGSRLNTLGNRLVRRFKQNRRIEDLNEAIKAIEKAVSVTPIGHRQRACRLNNLGNGYNLRFQHTGVIEDLDGAIEVTEIALDVTPPDDPDRAIPLTNLGNHLCCRFEQSGAIGDLDRAIEVAEMAVKNTQPTHGQWSARLSNLGCQLFSRFERIGKIQDLNRAIEVTEIALHCISFDDSSRASILNNLAECLGRRFEQIGTREDLNRAVELAEEAVDTTPQGHPDRAGRLNTLASQLSRRSERTTTLRDLNYCIEITIKAIDITPHDHFQRAGRLNNLGNRFNRRYEQTGAIEDLNQAIKFTEESVDTTPFDYFGRAGRLYNLANRLGTRFERTKATEDLSRAIKSAKEAVDTTPVDNPGRAARLSSLGGWLGTRFEIFEAVEDLEQSISYFREGWNCRSAPPSTRISLAWNAATFLASQSNWEECSRFLQGGVELLPNVSPRWLQHTDKQLMLANFAGLASMAAATALNNGKDASHALQLLELGRGVVASLLMDLRTDISDLDHQHPGLAGDFNALRDELDSPVDDAVPHLGHGAFDRELQTKQRREAEERFQKVIEEIRMQPGFGNFLRPPTKKELTTAANVGPIIVINMSPYRCDAFLVKHNGITSLKLPELSTEVAQEKAEDLRSSHSSLTSVLAWLWDVIAQPCLQALGLQSVSLGDEWQRIWWIPTGWLTHLPIHAAGRHFDGSRDTVIDRVVSSYSSSIRTLIHQRRREMPTSKTSVSGHALLVGMRETPGHPVLPFAAREVNVLEELFLSADMKMGLRPVLPPLRCRSHVLEHLRTCRIFHFAGHGESHPSEPTKSRLLLEDWEICSLTVADLRDLRLQNNSPFLAYLSACSTGTNKSATLVDESIHLISACQLAGFRNVVGTLWDVDDEYCVVAARELYNHIAKLRWTDEAVALGTHRAIRLLRDVTRYRRRRTSPGFVRPGYATRLEGDPSVWACYVHFGP
jgi:tetratricopeptide (TPR) repeat protein